MLKRMILFLMIASVSYAGVWSSSGEDGIHQAFSELDELVKQLNEKTQDKWTNEIEPLIEEVAKETNKKNTLLKEIEAIEKDKVVNEKEIIFYLEQEKNLLGNYDSIISIQKEAE